jgi:hypothetical protein
MQQQQQQQQQQQAGRDLSGLMPAGTAWHAQQWDLTARSTAADNGDSRTSHAIRLNHLFISHTCPLLPAVSATASCHQR